MEKQFPEKLYQAVGLICCQVHIRYAGILCIGLGEKVYYTHPRLKKSFRGEWDIRSYSSAWRLVKGHQIICGSYDSEEECDPHLKMLEGKILVGIKKVSFFDVSFNFSDELTVDIFGRSGTDQNLEVYLPGGNNLELKNGKWFEYTADDRICSLSQEEQLISDYSEECSKRWEGLIPSKQSINFCYKCSYYRPIRGRFHFWDYGLCSNGLSAHDGKVVNLKYGCLHYDSSLPTLER